MKAPNISHTVLSAKPPSAHRTDSVAVGATRSSAEATVTPMRPMTAPGMGSVIRAPMTAVNSAK